MENRQMCSWGSGVRVQDNEQKAAAAAAVAAQCSAPFCSKITCGIYCAVAIAALCCFYNRLTQAPSRLYKKIWQWRKSNRTRATNNANDNGCCSSCVQNQPGTSMMEQLVPEIRTHVLSYLDYPSLCRLSKTNSNMRRAANDDNVWKALYNKDFTTEQNSVSPPNGWKSYYAGTKAVKDVNAVYCRILRAKNVQDMSQLWLRADYVKCVHPGGLMLSGYGAVMESWELVFNWIQRYDCQVHDVRMRVGGDMAWVTLKEYVNAVVEPFLVTNTYEFHNGQWFMVQHHSSPTTIAGAVDPGIFGG